MPRARHAAVLQRADRRVQRAGPKGWAKSRLAASPGLAWGPGRGGQQAQHGEAQNAAGEARCRACWLEQRDRGRAALPFCETRSAPCRVLGIVPLFASFSTVARDERCVASRRAWRRLWRGNVFALCAA